MKRYPCERSAGSAKYEQHKILVLTPWWPDSSRPWAGTFVRNQAWAMHGMGAEVSAVVATPIYHARRRLDATTITAQHAGVALFPRYWMAEWSWPRAGRALRAWLQSDFDDVIIHTEVLAAIAAPHCRSPYVVVIHGTNTDTRPIKNAARRRMIAEALRKAKAVVVVGSSLHDWVRSTYAYDGPLTCVENGFDPEVLTCNPAAPLAMNRRPRVSCVGALDVDKGQRMLLDAARDVTAIVGPIAIDLVGDGPDRCELEKRARSLVDVETVFHGWCDPARAASIISESDIFVLPSRREALGIVYLNAMALGRPVIGVKGQGIDGVVVHGENGFLVTPDAIGELASTIVTVLASPSEARLIGEKGRRTATVEFSWTRNAERMMNLLRRHS